VILGGLVAGVIINIFEFVLNGVVLAKDMEAATTALGRQVGGNQLAMFIGWGFLVGIFAIWLYAAIRPRYGAGAKTALCAGAAVWGLGYLLAAVTPIALHLFPRHIMAIGLAVGLVEVLALPRRNRLTHGTRGQHNRADGLTLILQTAPSRPLLHHTYTAGNLCLWPLSQGSEEEPKHDH
jgi:hypothetical protein